MILCCEFIGWSNLHTPEQIALLSAIFTGLAVLGTAIYVKYTYNIMDSNRESVRILSEKEKPFLCITNIEATREIRHIDGVGYHLWEITVANGGLTNGIIQSMSVEARTFKVSETYPPVKIKAISYVEQFFVAPNHDRTFLCGFDFEFTGNVTNPNDDLTADITVTLYFNGIGSDSYTYVFTGEYFKKLKRFVGTDEKYIERSK